MLDLLKQSSDTVVSRFVVAGGSDPLRQQLRLSHLLNGADFRPTGMSGSYILLIRKLRDPSPALLRAGTANGRVPPEWEQGVRDSVSQFMRLAARPSEGDLTNCENAVLFLDRAELLACLARDWCDSRLVERWWWRSLLRNDYSFWTTWIRNPEYIPAAIAQLARSRTVARFAAALSEEEAHILTQRLIETFALNALTRVIASPEVGNAIGDYSSPDDRVQPAGKQFRNKVQPGTRQSRVAAPWHDAIPERTVMSLPAAQQLFVGLAFMIYRAPSLVRTTSFAQEVAQWQREEIQTHSDVSTPAQAEIDLPSLTESRRREPDAPETQASKRRTSEHHERAPVTEPDEIKRGGIRTDSFEHERIRKHAFDEFPELKFTDLNHSPPGFDQPPLTTETTSPDGVERHTDNEILRDSALLTPVSTVSQIEEGVIHHVSTDADATDSPAFSEDQSESITSQSLEPELFANVEIETSLGGLFYLINLALYLDLYADFTCPAAEESELSIWDFLALVGSELVHDAAGDDPIFSLLATLAGRDQDEPAGESFEPADHWRLPIEWLSSDVTQVVNSRSVDQTQVNKLRCQTKDVWHWNVTDDRLRVRHPEGFMVLDLPIDGGNVLQQLHNEIEPYRELFLELERSPLENEVPNPRVISPSSTQVWLARLMPYVRARLRAALGSGANEDPGPFVCRQHALVRVTETCVDAFFNLSEHPIELRLAGLDRDPGWVPAAGRFIRFHYN
jgi:hypothetical protein